MLSFADLSENAGFRALSFKSSQGIIKRFIVFDMDFSQLQFPPSATRQGF